MGNYMLYDDELYHYGVKGMKWGVRKSDYKSMTRKQRKEVRKKYYDTPEGKISRATTIGTILAGPLGGVIAGSIANKKYNSDSIRASASKGKKFIDDNANKKVSELSNKTESKRVSDIKSRVTGRKENGKPAFLMSQKEMDEFSARYEQRKNALSKRYKNATDAAEKQRILKEADRLEDDYLSVVEQDFWYSDD